jgi:deoxyadenosine/deoxycytidine kinase
LAPYEYTWTALLEGLPSTLDVRFIYLWAKTPTLVDRIKQRSRNSESNIPEEY